VARNTLQHAPDARVARTHAPMQSLTARVAIASAGLRRATPAKRRQRAPSSRGVVASSMLPHLNGNFTEDDTAAPLVETVEAAGAAAVKLTLEAAGANDKMALRMWRQSCPELIALWDLSAPLTTWKARWQTVRYVTTYFRTGVATSVGSFQLPG